TCVDQHFIGYVFFQAEDGIRDDLVTGVQTCALPIYQGYVESSKSAEFVRAPQPFGRICVPHIPDADTGTENAHDEGQDRGPRRQIGRASCRERALIRVGAGSSNTKYAGHW